MAGAGRAFPPGLEAAGAVTGFNNGRAGCTGWLNARSARFASCVSLRLLVVGRDAAGDWNPACPELGRPAAVTFGDKAA
jgi:hypothetical protein